MSTVVVEAVARPTLRMQRVFDAPRELVWRAWSNPEVLVLWMGPVEWPAVSATADFRVGGSWRICLHSPETGENLWQGGVYREIEAPRRLVFTSDGTKAMRTARPSIPWSPSSSSRPVMARPEWTSPTKG